MKVLVLSDIHANLFALNEYFNDILEADYVICVGDIVGYYTYVNEVVDLMRKHCHIAVKGNHEYFLEHGAPDTCSEHVKWALSQANRVISASNRDYLKKLPLMWSGEIGGRRFLVAHGSPWSPITDYLYSDSDKIAKLSDFDVDYVICGQTHRPWIKSDCNPCIINAGSIGQSRHKIGVANAVTIDTVTNEVEILEREYNVSRLVDACVSEGAGNWITKHLLRQDSE